jgi:hypothetical protein
MAEATPLPMEPPAGMTDNELRWHLVAYHYFQPGPLLEVKREDIDRRHRYYHDPDSDEVVDHDHAR